MTSTTTQESLPLAFGDQDWKLDPTTREIGRRGLAAARAALEAADRRRAQRDDERRLPAAA